MNKRLFFLIVIIFFLVIFFTGDRAFSKETINLVVNGDFEQEPEPDGSIYGWYIARDWYGAREYIKLVKDAGFVHSGKQALCLLKPFKITLTNSQPRVGNHTLTSWNGGKRFIYMPIYPCVAATSRNLAPHQLVCRYQTLLGRE